MHENLVCVAYVLYGRPQQGHACSCFRASAMRAFSTRRSGTRRDVMRRFGLIECSTGLRSLSCSASCVMRRLTVGMVGYPNVGKSSTINVLIGSKKARKPAAARCAADARPAPYPTMSRGISCRGRPWDSLSANWHLDAFSVQRMNLPHASRLSQHRMTDRVSCTAGKTKPRGISSSLRS